MNKKPETESAMPSIATSQFEAEKNTILHELHELMESAPFRGSQQCRSFLSYVVTHTLSGDEGSLRERVIGNSVFGRPPDYDTGDDPVVRIRASEVRKRLAQSYQSRDRQPDVTIQIPSGSYRAVFFWGRSEVAPQEGLLLEDPHTFLLQEDPVPQASQPATLDAPPPTTANIRTTRWLIPVMAAIALVGIVGTVIHDYGQNRPERELSLFWQPFLKNPKPVLISVGSNAVYRLSDQVADAYSRDHHLEASGMEFFPQLQPDATLDSSGIHPAPDSFVALGDVAAVSQTVANLTRMHKGFQERFSNDISFAEIRSSPTILVGGFNNPMTRELTRNFRFAFISRNRIDDRQNPGKSWVLNASQDSHDTEDYALISRIPVGDDSAPLISVAGLGQYGTLAATNFVFDPQRLTELQKSLPTNWRNRNLQILLHIKVTDFKPGSITVVALHSW
jgi:hypothetical protein